MIETIRTQNSVYELDRDSKRIRRVEGKNPPTSSFHPEGEWKEYQSIDPIHDGSLFGPVVHWGGSRYTFLSPVEDPNPLG